jgi:hypothetical protein
LSAIRPHSIDLDLGKDCALAVFEARSHDRGILT